MKRLRMNPKRYRSKFHYHSNKSNRLNSARSSRRGGIKL